ncbi:MAG: M48 family metalloprotease [Candidatus Doudnabacteria bacterium]|nr:M48 family metalloprotease [Candidatus Doudnabacteria bacterium]
MLGGNNGLIVFLIFGVIMNLVSFWFSDKIALAMSGATELTKGSAPALEQITKELSHEMGIPTPRLFISPQPQPNAFATGRSPKTGVVCLTQGLINSLPQEQVAGVIAHELAHIKNRDVLISTVAAVIAGAISAIGNIALWAPRDEEDSNPIASILLVILAPIAATLIQFAISRSREFAADAVAAQTMGSGKPLADALVSISTVAERYPMDINPALSSLYIANPLGGRQLASLFSTHPPTEERIAKLLTI